MALLEKKLVIRKSALPGAGRGLFTKKIIPKGTRIVEYKGRMTTWKEVDHDEGRNGYIYYISRSKVIDAYYSVKTYGRYANDARGLSRVNGLFNNSEYVEEGIRVYIQATRDIPAGSEILVAYGKEYWDIIRYNLRIEREQSGA
jgi:hypothetical protein